MPSLPAWADQTTTAKTNWVSIAIDIPNEAPPHNAIGDRQRSRVRFSLPDNSQNPTSTIGAASRGFVQFSLPSDTQNPRSTAGAGSRGTVQFGLPDEAGNPRSTVGAGSRGTVQFTLPDQNGNPRSVTGAGSRGNVRFALPDGRDNPNSTVGAGSREAEQIVLAPAPLTALLPASNNGRTVASHPTVYVYLPPLGTEEIFFSIQDQHGNFHYDTFLKGSPEGGIIAITIPDTAPALEMDKPYLWYFAPIEPGDRLQPNNYAVTGWIKRVKAETSLNNGLEQSTIQIATEYARQGIWYDTLQTLADALLANPSNPEISTEWHDLLEQIDLEVLSTQSIIKSS